MSHRVFANEFSDEHIKEHSDFLYQCHRNAYPYMLGFVYANRLLNIYRDNREIVLSKINDILSGKSSVKDLLNDYSISLTDKETCRDFINLCNQYRDIVESRYSSSQLYSVR